LAAICSLIRTYNWKVEDVGRLSWGQIEALNRGTAELCTLQKRDDPAETKTPEELAQDVDYQNGMARALLASTKPNGELDAALLAQALKR